MQAGKVTRRDPWLLQPDGFETLSNCRIKRGVLEKRRGFAFYGQILAIDTTTLDPTLQTNPVMGIFNHLSGTTENLLAADQDRLNEYVSGRPVNKTISAVADLGGSPNRVRFTTAAVHGLTADEIGTIVGDSDWNGTHRIENVSDTTHFDIEHAASDTVVDSGTAISQEAFTDLTENKIKFKKDTSMTSPAVGVVIESADTIYSGAGFAEVLAVLTDYGTFAANTAYGTIIFKRGTHSGTFTDGEKLQYFTLAFTSGGTHEVLVGDTLTGATSGSTCVVTKITLSSGTWAGGDAAGTFHLRLQSAALQSENLNEGANNNVCTIASDSTQVIVALCNGTNSDEAFTGDNTDFFWSENWDHDGASDITYITNNQNPIQIYNGTHLRQLSIDIGTDAARVGDNDINSCLLVIVFKERVIIFSTNENGVDYFQRARWSGVKQPFSWPTANFKDAPTSDIIKSVDFIGDELYVWFERSTWRFTWTGDSTNPFEWERVSDTEGAVAQMSLVTQDDRQFAVGAARIQLSNGRDVVAADSLIPDFVLDWNQDSLPYSNSLLLDEEKHILMSYASEDATAHGDGNVYPDRAVVINYEDNNFATYGLPIHTMGFSNVESDLTWDDVAEAWKDIDYSWNAGQAKSGFPTTLMGNHAGKIFQLNFSGSDDTAAIEFEAVGGRWNPYTKKGHKAKLGYIEFLVDVDASVTFDVLNYINTDATAFQTKTITCDAVRGSDVKAWKRVDVFAIADFHRIKITNNATNNRPRIHAIVPYFQDAEGRLN